LGRGKTFKIEKLVNRQIQCILHQTRSYQSRITTLTKSNFNSWENNISFYWGECCPCVIQNKKMNKFKLYGILY